MFIIKCDSTLHPNHLARHPIITIRPQYILQIKWFVSIAFLLFNRNASWINVIEIRTNLVFGDIYRKILYFPPKKWYRQSKNYRRFQRIFAGKIKQTVGGISSLQNCFNWWIHFSRRKKSAPAGILLQVPSLVRIEGSSIFRCGDKIV